MMNLVTTNIATGISAADTRKNKLEATTLGADFQTIRKRGGMLRKARSRSLHREGGPCGFAAFSTTTDAALIEAGLPCDRDSRVLKNFGMSATYTSPVAGAALWCHKRL